jgi:hypothetical protein
MTTMLASNLCPLVGVLRRLPIAHAYVAGRWSGVQVIDITDSQSLRTVGGLDTGDAMDVAVSGMRVYVADSDDGLAILPAQCGPVSAVGENPRAAPRILLRAQPIPGSGQALIHFETRDGGLVQVSLYDVAGRLIRELSDQMLTAGGHDVRPVIQASADAMRQERLRRNLMEVLNSQGADRIVHAPRLVRTRLAPIGRQGSGCDRR